MEALRTIDGWGAATAAAGVAQADGVVATHGPSDLELPWASVTKLLTGLAILVALEEGTVDLDEPAGPPGSTLRHLLSHASGLPLDGDRPITEPGRRRIYSNTGIELAARLLEQRAEMPFADYFAHAVVRPLGLTGRLAGSPAHAYRGPLDDLLAIGRELLRPTLVAPETLAEATTVQFPGLTGVLPGLGRMDLNDWGLTFELRDSKSPHWTGTAQLRAHVRPLRRERHVPLGRSGRGGRVRRPHRSPVRRLGEGGVAAVQRRGALRALVVVGEERAQQLVEGRPVAARDHRRRHRGHRRRARHVHGGRDLAEVVARAEHAARAELALADGEDAGEEDVETVVRLALAHEDGPGATSRRSIRCPSRASVSPGSPASSSIRASSCWVAERYGEAISSPESA